MNTYILMIYLSTFVLCKQSEAFDTQAHALITRESYARSRLSTDPALIETLLLNRLEKSEPFRRYWLPGDPATEYYSVYMDDLRYRDSPSEFERCQMADFLDLLGTERNSFGYRWRLAHIGNVVQCTTNCGISTIAG